MKVKMLNKIVAVIAAAASMGLVSCNKSSDGKKTSGGKKELTFLLNSPELTEAYKECFAEYEKETGVRITADILQNDYQTVLKTRLNSGDIPDLFLTSAYNDNKVFGQS